MRKWPLVGGLVLAIMLAGCGATTNLFKSTDEVGATPQERLYLARSYLEKGLLDKALEVASAVKESLAQAGQTDSSLYREACLIAGQAKIGQQNLGVSNLVSIADRLDETLGQLEGRIDEQNIIEALEDTGLFTVQRDEAGNIVAVERMDEEKEQALEEGREDLRDSLGVEVEDTDGDGVADEVTVAEEAIDPDAGATLVAADIALAINNALVVFDQDGDGDVTQDEVNATLQDPQDLEEHKEQLGEMLVSVEEGILVADKIKDQAGLQEEFVSQLEENKDEVLSAINQAQQALAANDVEAFKDELRELLNLAS